MKKFSKLLAGFLAFTLVLGSFPVFSRAEGDNLVWKTGEDGKSYWYENGVKQGTVDDVKGVLGDDTIRGREIYDPESDAWYWLDACYAGAKAVNKEVWMPYVYQNEKEWVNNETELNNNCDSSDIGDVIKKSIQEGTGKWVRYDADGAMIKGWCVIEGELAELYPDEAGNIYFYDNKTGAMAKGEVTLENVIYYFNEISGALEKSLVREWKSVSEKTVDANGNKLSERSYELNDEGWLVSDTCKEYNEDDGDYYLYSVTKNEYENESYYYASHTETYYNPDDSLDYSCEITYEDGLEVKNVTKDDSGNVISTLTYKYDANGNETESLRVEPDQTFKTISTYDENDRLIKTLSYMDGELYRTCTYEYDSEGNEILYISEDEDDGSGTKEIYTYDSNNNILSKESYGKSGSEFKIEAKEVNEYNSDNKLVKTTYYSYNFITGAEKTVSRVEKTYNDYGNEEKTLKYSYDSEGNSSLSSKTVYKYQLLNVFGIDCLTLTGSDNYYYENNREMYDYGYESVYDEATSLLKKTTNYCNDGEGNKKVESVREFFTADYPEDVNTGATYTYIGEKDYEDGNLTEEKYITAKYIDFITNW